MDRRMLIASTLLKLRPQLLGTESEIADGNVDKLVMSDTLDFGSGQEIKDILDTVKSETTEVTSTESEDAPNKIDSTYTPVEASAYLFKGNETFTYPTVEEAILIKTAFNAAPSEQIESFNKLLDRVNVEFQAIWHKSVKEITPVVQKLVELTGENGTEASRIMDTIKNGNILFIRK